MKVEVRNVKEAKFASDETMCFQATIVIDDKVAGTVSNDGHGGCNFYKDFEGEPMEHDADTAIGDLVYAYLTQRDLERKLKSHVVLRKEDGRLYTVKVAKGVDTKMYAQKYVGRPGVVKVLNMLPPDEALAEWRATS